MKKILLFIAFAIAICTGFAQTNVGIGTSTPGSNLQVNGSFAANWSSPATSTYALAATDHFVLYSGTVASTFTLPAAVSGSGNFKGREYVIKNGITGTVATGTATQSGGAVTWVSGTTFTSAMVGGTIKLNGVTETISFVIASPNAAGVTQSQTVSSAAAFSVDYGLVPLTITAAGSELIDGSSSVTVLPGTTVTLISNGSTGSVTTWNVAGATAASGSGTGWSTTGNTGTTASSAAIGTTVNNNFIGTADATDFVLATRNTERMRISMGGLVGINNSTPSAFLDVVGNAYIKDAVPATSGIKFTASSSANYIESAGAAMADATVADLNFTDMNDHHTWMVIKSTGLTGIGNSSPGSLLRVGPGAGVSSPISGTALSTTFVTDAGALGTTLNNTLTLASIGFNSSNSSSLGIHALRNAAGSDWTSTAIGLVMDVDNTPIAGGAQIWLSNNGGVGIGTATPHTSLDVNGAVSARVTSVTLGTSPYLIPSATIAGTSYILLTSTSSSPSSNVFYLPPGSNGQLLTIELNPTLSGSQNQMEILSGYQSAAPSGAATAFLNAATYVFALPASTLQLIYDSINSAWVQVGGSASLATNINKSVFNYTGGNQTWVCPTGVTSVTVELWGGGGAGGYNSAILGSGGGGGFVSGTLAVTAGLSYTIVVGGGGTTSGAGSTNAFGGGGSGNHSSTANLSGGGGGRSAILNQAQTTEYVAAGGGGGGACGNKTSYGGAGGASSALLGTGGGTGGAGGTTTTPGAAGGGGGSTAGSGTTGGAGGTCSACGGGGGGGHEAGGGGQGASSNGGGGGGGSNFTGGLATTTNNLAGTTSSTGGTAPPNTSAVSPTIPDYTLGTNVGIGAIGANGTGGSQGGPGLVVIYW